jgi:hypothetical protein
VWKDWIPTLLSLAVMAELVVGDLAAAHHEAAPG